MVFESSKASLTSTQPLRRSPHTHNNNNKQQQTNKSHSIIIIVSLWDPRQKRWQ